MLFVRVDYIIWAITMFKIDTHRVFSDRLDVAYVPLTTQHVVVGSQKFLNRLGLCRRLYYNQIFAHIRAIIRSNLQKIAAKVV